MCTVTYLPQSEGQFLLTSNRDEAPHRSPENLDRITFSGQELLFPRDEGAGGTWIVASSNGTALCILNGAYSQHHHQPPYRRSRGLMALDYFSFANTAAFIRQYTFNGMEPFTMLVINQGSVTDLRWDETQLHVNSLDPQRPHIWSSSTLYSPIAKRKREDWFASWLSVHPTYRREDILHWHRTAGDGDPENDVVMNRGNLVRTVSITSIHRSPGGLSMAYHDLLRQQSKTAQLPIVHEALAIEDNEH